MLKLTPDNFHSFLKIVIGENSDNYTNLVKNYFELRFRIENIKNQDWYFRKGLSSNIKKLEFLKKRYLHLLESINSNSLEQLQNNILESQQSLEKLEFSYSKNKSIKGLIYNLTLHAYKSKINECKNLYEMKLKYDKLVTFDRLNIQYEQWANSR